MDGVQALGGESVFLEAAVGFFGEGHLDDAGLDEWEDVALVVEIGVGKSGRFEELSFGFWAFGASSEQSLIGRRL